MSIRTNILFAAIWLANTTSAGLDGHHGFAAFAFLCFMLFGMCALMGAMKLAERRKQYLHIGIWGLK